jgi:hypothetical protein
MAGLARRSTPARPSRWPANFRSGASPSVSRFADGAAGEVDLGTRLRFDGVFARLRDPAAFGQARIDPDWGSLAWPGGADLCPDVLRAWLNEGGRQAEIVGEADSAL